ncbi:Vacuolar protein-sorting-associated protein 33 [Phytophthora citrophthora]|uniref:Vacuolar protein-sorting-associated protein 33 n=1 Tax=Phytophthora citrophthora TaxID=4793 RepID=A0AAD9FYT5_9STRA|nr:Vacuolar protein-sorting-associated protein 33 [Phytophthora citrophthora]
MHLRLGVFYERRPGAGFLDSGNTACSFQFVAHTLAVIDVDINIKNPKNAAFVTSGYEPITARLVEEILKHGHWRGIDAVMRHLPGPRAEVHLTENDRQDKTNSTTEEPKKPKSKKKSVVVVGFVGGVTFLEIAALRWIASFYPVELIIASTSIINGKTFVNEILEHIPPTTA